MLPIGVAGILVGVAPSIIPPRILMFEGKFPNLIEVFADISKNPPEPCSELARKYLYLCRLTGLIWLVWAVNFSVFMLLGLGMIFSMAELPELQLRSMKLIGAAGLALLFIGVVFITAMLRFAIELRDQCIRLCAERPKPRSAPRRRAGDAKPQAGTA